MHDHEVLTVADIARWLRISPNMVYGLVHENKLPHFRVGKCIRFDAEVIEDWIKRNSCDQPGDSDE